jgi:hypothetical protein
MQIGMKQQGNSTDVPKEKAAMTFVMSLIVGLA